jgi:hypothetical protein
MKMLKTIPEMLAAAKREWIMRQRVYPRWVQEGRMKEDQAQHEIDCMECIVHLLIKCQLLQEVSEDMIEMDRQRQAQPKPQQAELKI